MSCLRQERESAELFLLREAADKVSGVIDPASANRDELEREKEKVLLCCNCSTLITRENQRFSKEGKHLHTFFNPAGIVYEIGCFRSASGCLAHGAVSSDFSWFSGYRWQIGVCIACLEHIGWYFRGGNSPFFGLIVNRLKEG